MGGFSIFRRSSTRTRKSPEPADAMGGDAKRNYYDERYRSSGGGGDRDRDRDRRDRSRH